MKLSKLSLITPTVALLFAVAAPALAMQLSDNGNMTVINKDPIAVKFPLPGKTDADAKISARMAALNNLEIRLGQMVRISSEEKASLSATIQSSINDMANLKAKIDADTDNTVLKTDIQSITKSYRIYLLVLPQGRIIAAGDRVVTIAGLMDDLSVKLQLRITAAPNLSAQETAALNASLSDMNAKSGDASTQAKAAIAEVINLQPDNGDQAVFASNQIALKDARNKIKLAISDLKTARQDAGSIVKILVTMKIGNK